MQKAYQLFQNPSHSGRFARPFSAYSLPSVGEVYLYPTWRCPYTARGFSRNTEPGERNHTVGKYHV